MNEKKPEVGDFLHPDGWIVGENLLADDGFSDASFSGCQFRLPAGGIDDNGHPRYLLAVNVTVTGRLRCCGGLKASRRCRCRIEFVGDGEPSSFSGGWLYKRHEST